jgi:hypothetical protein
MKYFRIACEVNVPYIGKVSVSGEAGMRPAYAASLYSEE